MSHFRCVIVTIAGLLLGSGTAMAQIAQPTLPSVTNVNMLVPVDFDSLTEIEKRRVDFYADKIISALSYLATAEESGENSEIVKQSHEVHALVQRFHTTTLAVDLSEEETSDYFFSLFARNFTGRIPSILSTSDGRFDVDALLFGDVSAVAESQGGSGDYLDLLRGETAGGVATSN